jgi:hypothetical protein
MFGTVDETRPYSVITVREPVKIMPLRRAPLAPGVYKIQGDIRGKLGHVRDRRLQASNIFTVDYVEGEPREKYETSLISPEVSEIVSPESERAITEEVPKTLPGVESQLSKPKVKEVEEEPLEAPTSEKPKRKRRTRKAKKDEAKVVDPQPITPDAVEPNPYEASAAPAKPPVENTPPTTVEPPEAKEPDVADPISDDAAEEFDLGDLDDVDEPPPTADEEDVPAARERTRTRSS